MDNGMFADRIMDVPLSFIREILKVALEHSIISFAGGLPNRQLFPVEEIKAAAIKVLDTQPGCIATQQFRRFCSNMVVVTYFSFGVAGVILNIDLDILGCLGESGILAVFS